MELVNTVKLCFKKSVDFSGRAGRQEYWLFLLFQFLVISVLSACEWFANPTGDNPATIFTFLSVLFILGTFMPGLSVLIRRLHDTEKSGWFCLLNLIFFVGPIILLVFMCTKSDPIVNRYGPIPEPISNEKQ